MHVDYYLAHNQQCYNILRWWSVATHKSSIIPVPYLNTSFMDAKMVELIRKLSTLIIGSYISIKEYKDKYIELSLQETLIRIEI